MKKIIFLLLLTLVILPMISSLTSEERKDYKLCLNECTEIKKISKELCREEYSLCKTNCTGNRSCTSLCLMNKNECLKNENSNYTFAKDECRKIILPACINGNNSYKSEETFEDNCNICKCGKNGKISCKKEAFCNKNTTISKDLCMDSGGFYHSICNGPYFSIICSQEKFCLCEGTSNYSCPNDYECLKDFVSPNKRKQSIKGFKDLLGNSLGDIGICVK